MPTDIDVLWLTQALKQSYGRRFWSVPEKFGPNGWLVRATDGGRSLVVTCSDVADDPTEWIHASLTGANDVPSYDELKTLHRAVFRDGWAYQVFAPPSDHVNIHERALHLFGRLDGAPALPDFTGGTGLI